MLFTLSYGECLFAVQQRNIRALDDVLRQYLYQLGKGAFLIDGALDICRKTHASGSRIYIVTNGILATQQSRIKATFEVNMKSIAMFGHQEQILRTGNYHVFACQVYSDIGTILTSNEWAYTPLSCLVGIFAPNPTRWH